MGSVLSSFEPKEVLYYFEQLCAIPHGSRNTKAISDYCVSFAKERGFKYRQDESNNVIIWKDGSKGYEDHAPVILQGHLDMVCEKDADCDIDFSKDGLRLDVKDGKLYAKGTTLGGDDGIAVAYCLAILASDTIAHPPIEAIFTVDEEIGMLGAAAIDLSDIKGRLLLNIDSEDEGILTVSCAGGATSTVLLPLKRENASGILYRIGVDGLQGGHSGVEINKGRCNSNKLMAELLDSVLSNAPARLVSLSGGQKDNAIPRATVAELLVDEAAVSDFELVLSGAKTVLLAEHKALEAKLCVNAENCGKQTKNALSVLDSLRAVKLLCELPNGVQKMSDKIEGLVQTSLNMGILTMSENEMKMTFSVRSSVNTEKEELIGTLRTIAANYGASYSQMGEYPAWEYCEDSRLRPLMIEVFEELYGHKPVVEAIHAGLECGILSDKLPGLDAVSFGPDMEDIHTTREKLSLDSTKRTWDYLLAILERL